MNIRLKISPKELIVLNIVLNQVLANSANNSIVQSSLMSILNNIKQKRKDLPIIDENFIDMEKILSKMFLFQSHVEQDFEKQESCSHSAPCTVNKITCTQCHFFNNHCQKEKEIKRYWGHDDAEFLSYFYAYQNEGANDCIMFEHKITYTILEFKEPLFSLEIHENNETVKRQFSAHELRFIIHKYGKDAFVNMNDFEQLIYSF